MTPPLYYLFFDDEIGPRAACRDAEDPDLWHPTKGDWETQAKAKAICAGCEVRDECLEGADERDERHGIWGGLTPTERRRIRRVRTPQKIAQLQDCSQQGTAA